MTGPIEIPKGSGQTPPPWQPEQDDWKLLSLCLNPNVSQQVGTYTHCASTEMLFTCISFQPVITLGDSYVIPILQTRKPQLGDVSDLPKTTIETRKLTARSTLLTTEPHCLDLVSTDHATPSGPQGWPPTCQLPALEPPRPRWAPQLSTPPSHVSIQTLLCHLSMGTSEGRRPGPASWSEPSKGSCVAMPIAMPAIVYAICKSLGLAHRKSIPP